MTARMLGTIAVVFSMLFTAGCSNTPKKETAAKPHWAGCMAKGGLVLGIPGAAYNLATGGAAFVAGAVLGGSACAMADSAKAEDNGYMGVPAVAGMSTAHFALDSDYLTDNAKTEISDIIGQINDDTRIDIIGHACDLGTRKHNQDLSERRADSVYKYLESRGIPTSNMKQWGEGEDNPINANADEAQRSENRRVEIRVMK
ncbi:OmpA family protein [Endozoicomonas sp. OPT23]|uniref:OmpA family protein n=1 Tax=Endozoicomonas sp. OPT23 TaxID=2072845 RepID=UPI001890DDCE|nr:OmpA family protein [Endozoicomonas sp. OPT23]